MQTKEAFVQIEATIQNRRVNRNKMPTRGHRLGVRTAGFQSVNRGSSPRGPTTPFSLLFANDVPRILVNSEKRVSLLRGALFLTAA